MSKGKGKKILKKFTKAGLTGVNAVTKLPAIGKILVGILGAGTFIFIIRKIGKIGRILTKSPIVKFLVLMIIIYLIISFLKKKKAGDEETQQNPYMNGGNVPPQPPQGGGIRWQ